MDHVYSSDITNILADVTELHIANHQAVTCTLHGVTKASINAPKTQNSQLS